MIRRLALILLVLGMFLVNGSTAVEAQTTTVGDCTGSGSSYCQNIWRTGTTGTVNNQIKRLGGGSDNNWEVARVYSDAGFNNLPATNMPSPTSTCQYYSLPALSAAVPANPPSAVLVNEYVRQSDGVLRSGGYPESEWYIPPPAVPPDSHLVWDASTAARWISINNKGWHDGYDNDPVNSKPPAPPGECTDPSSSDSTPPVPPFAFWHTYVFRLEGGLNVPNNVDLNSLSIYIEGASDNHIGISVNKHSLHMTCGGLAEDFHRSNFTSVNSTKVGHGDPLRPVNNPWLNLCSPTQNFNQTNNVIRTRADPNSFRVGNNEIEIHVKSAYSNVGLMLEKIRLVGNLSTNSPTGTISLTCEVGTGVLTADVNASDPDGGNVSVSVSVNNGATPASRTGSGSGVINLNGGNTFQGIPDGSTVYVATARITDDEGEERTITSAGRTCPRPPLPAGAITCSVTATPSSVEVNDLFRIRVVITHNGPDFSPSINSTNNPLTLSSSPALTNLPGGNLLYIPSPLAVDQTASYQTAANISAGSPGSYLITARIANLPGGDTTCPVTVVASYKPYLRVYGGEVIAGASYGNTCTPTTSDIRSFAKQIGSGAWVGAGSQFGSASNGIIEEFATATLLLPSNPSLLAFANVAPANPNFGGNFQGCFRADNYWPAILPANGSAVINNTTSGRFSLSSGSTLTQTAPLEFSTVIYVLGDLRIGSDITTTTSWANPESIPSLYVVVLGNIHIAPNVKQLDGVFIAQPTRITPTIDDGRIFTCFNTTVIDTTSKFISENCGEKLTVNGALLAAKVNFLRTKGTLSSAGSSEAAGSANIAESIQFTPELLLGIPSLNPSSSSARYNSITSLSPSL